MPTEHFANIKEFNKKDFRYFQHYVQFFEIFAEYSEHNIPLLRYKNVSSCTILENNMYFYREK